MLRDTIHTDAAVLSLVFEQLMSGLGTQLALCQGREGKPITMHYGMNI